MTAFPVELPPPPKAASDEAASAGAVNLTLNIKSVKPPASFSLANVSPTDTILSIKERLVSENSRAPSVDIQRLLLKGKVLADNKLLKEYIAAAPGEEEINLSLMVKPGSTWTGEETKPAVVAPQPQRHPNLAGGSLSATGPRGHSRTPSEGGAADQYPVPSLMLSTPGSPTSEKDQPPVPLDIADARVRTHSRPSSPSSLAPGTGSISAVLTQPEFWVHLHEFLQREVRSMHDAVGFTSQSPRLKLEADELFESFLLASKVNLEASDIARIREAVNITGMAGT
ncbi:hypothetical protein DL93DRAFT_2144103 [Clavulina sp. PMI_390]|nr:hypothetical protein DL93DRAFT_2144103 [Clavulina sp. PMI_390]